MDGLPTEAQFRRMQGIIAMLQGDKNDLEAKVTMLSAAEEKARQANQKMARQLEDLLSKMEAVVKERNSLQAELQNSQKKMEQAAKRDNEEMVMLRSRIRSAEMSAAQADARVQETATLTENLQRELTLARDRMAKLQEAASASLEAASIIKSDRDTLANERDLAVAKQAQAERARGMALEERDALRARVDHLQSMVDAQVSELDSARGLLSALSAELPRVKSLQEAEVARLKASHEAALAAAKAAATQQQSHTAAEVQHMKQYYSAELQEVKRACEAEIAALQARHEAEVQHVHSQLADSQAHAAAATAEAEAARLKQRYSTGVMILAGVVARRQRQRTAGALSNWRAFVVQRALVEAAYQVQETAAEADALGAAASLEAPASGGPVSPPGDGIASPPQVGSPGAAEGVELELAEPDDGAGAGAGAARSSAASSNSATPRHRQIPSTPTGALSFTLSPGLRFTPRGATSYSSASAGTPSSSAATPQRQLGSSVVSLASLIRRLQHACDDAHARADASEYEVRSLRAELGSAHDRLAHLETVAVRAENEAAAAKAEAEAHLTRTVRRIKSLVLAATQSSQASGSSSGSDGSRGGGAHGQAGAAADDGAGIGGSTLASSDSGAGFTSPSARPVGSILTRNSVRGVLESPKELTNSSRSSASASAAAADGHAAEHTPAPRTSRSSAGSPDIRTGFTSTSSASSSSTSSAAAAADSDPWLEAIRLLTRLHAEEQRSAALQRELEMLRTEMVRKDADLESWRSSLSAAKDAAAAASRALGSEEARRLQLQAVIKRLRLLHTSDVDACVAMVAAGATAPSAGKDLLVELAGGSGSGSGAGGGLNTTSTTPSLLNFDAFDLNSSRVSMSSAIGGQNSALSVVSTLTRGLSLLQGRVAALDTEVREAESREARLREDKARLLAAMDKLAIQHSAAQANAISLRDTLAAERASSALLLENGDGKDRALATLQSRLRSLSDTLELKSKALAQATATQAMLQATADKLNAESTRLRSSLVGESNARADLEEQLSSLRLALAADRSRVADRLWAATSRANEVESAIASADARVLEMVVAKTEAESEAAKARSAVGALERDLAAAAADAAAARAEVDVLRQQLDAAAAAHATALADAEARMERDIAAARDGTRSHVEQDLAIRNADANAVRAEWAGKLAELEREHAVELEDVRGAHIVEVALLRKAADEGATAASQLSMVRSQLQTHEARAASLQMALESADSERRRLSEEVLALRSHVERTKAVLQQMEQLMVSQRSANDAAHAAAEKAAADAAAANARVLAAEARAVGAETALAALEQELDQAQSGNRGGVSPGSAATTSPASATSSSSPIAADSTKLAGLHEMVVRLSAAVSASEGKVVSLSGEVTELTDRFNRAQLAVDHTQSMNRQLTHKLTDAQLWASLLVRRLHAVGALLAPKLLEVVQDSNARSAPVDDPADSATGAAASHAAASSSASDSKVASLEGPWHVALAPHEAHEIARILSLDRVAMLQAAAAAAAATGANGSGDAESEAGGAGAVPAAADQSTEALIRTLQRLSMSTARAAGLLPQTRASSSEGQGGADAPPLADAAGGYTAAATSAIAELRSAVEAVSAQVSARDEELEVLYTQLDSGAETTRLTQAECLRLTEQVLALMEETADLHGKLRLLEAVVVERDAQVVSLVQACHSGIAPQEGRALITQLLSGSSLGVPPPPGLMALAAGSMSPARQQIASDSPAVLLSPAASSVVSGISAGTPGTAATASRDADAAVNAGASSAAAPSSVRSTASYETPQPSGEQEPAVGFSPASTASSAVGTAEAPTPSSPAVAAASSSSPQSSAARGDNVLAVARAALADAAASRSRAAAVLLLPAPDARAFAEPAEGATTGISTSSSNLPLPPLSSLSSGAGGASSTYARGFAFEPPTPAGLREAREKRALLSSPESPESGPASGRGFAASGHGVSRLSGSIRSDLGFHPTATGSAVEEQSAGAAEADTSAYGGEGGAYEGSYNDDAPGSASKTVAQAAAEAAAAVSAAVYAVEGIGSGGAHKRRPPPPPGANTSGSNGSVTPPRPPSPAYAGPGDDEGRSAADTAAMPPSRPGAGHPPPPSHPGPLDDASAEAEAALALELALSAPPPPPPPPMYPHPVANAGAGAGGGAGASTPLPRTSSKNRVTFADPPVTGQRVLTPLPTPSPPSSASSAASAASPASHLDPYIGHYGSWQQHMPLSPGPRTLAHAHSHSHQYHYGSGSSSNGSSPASSLSSYGLDEALPLAVPASPSQLPSHLPLRDTSHASGSTITGSMSIEQLLAIAASELQALIAGTPAPGGEGDASASVASGIDRGSAAPAVSALSMPAVPGPGPGATSNSTAAGVDRNAIAALLSVLQGSSSALGNSSQR